MARPKGGYKLKDGTRVPGTTTITGRYKDSAGLIHWAWDLGMNGVDYRAARDQAADAGTLAHDMIEARICGRDPFAVEGDPEQFEKARQAYDSFEEWFAGTRIKIVATEMPLVSEIHRFGGTPDGLGEEVSGAFCLLDWKSSNKIYPEYLLQLAAYRQLVEENGICGCIERFHLLRVGKEFCDFHHHSWPREALDPAWRAFGLMRDLYDLDKRLKSIAGT